jgi:hypothetical protein
MTRNAVLVGVSKEAWVDSAAHIGCVTAPGVETTGGGRFDELGDGALDGSQLASPVGSGGDGAHETTGVGVQRVAENLFRETDLDDAAGIHHCHPVADLADESQVMADV